MYLAWSLKRSKAVNGTQRVVGVVGRGHLRGIVWGMTRDSGQLRFTDLVQVGGCKGGCEGIVSEWVMRVWISGWVGESVRSVYNSTKSLAQTMGQGYECPAHA